MCPPPEHRSIEARPNRVSRRERVSPAPTSRAVPDHPLGALTGHWRAWRRRDELDRLLIDGAPPEGSPEVELRAQQLTEHNHRHHLAAELESVVAAVDAPESSRFAIDLRADEIRVARGALLELAAQLRRKRCLPRGVAMTRRLLRDPSSPLYEPAANDELLRVSSAACHALECAEPAELGAHPPNDHATAPA
jgi:hypothetical protein